jgi:type 1 fimbria pilin
MRRLVTTAALAVAALAATAAGASAAPAVAVDHRTVVVSGDDANDHLAVRIGAKALEVDFGDDVVRVIGRAATARSRSASSRSAPTAPSTVRSGTPPARPRR